MYPVFFTYLSECYNEDTSSLPQPGVDENGKYNSTAKIVVATICGDALIFLTSLVIAILGLVGVLQGIPPGASYFLITLSSCITLLWALSTVRVEGYNFFFAKPFLTQIVASEPNLDIDSD